MARKTGDVNRHYQWARVHAAEYVARRPRTTARELGPYLSGLQVPDGQEVPGDDLLARWITALRPKDDSGPWTIANAEPEDAAVVLPVLRWEVMRFRPWEPGEVALTTAVAAWVVRLVRAAPTLKDPQYVEALSILAHAYVAAADAKREDLDVLLAFEPWLDGCSAYVEAVRSGVIDHRRVAASGANYGPFEPIGAAWWEMFQARMAERGVIVGPREWVDEDEAKDEE